MVAGLAEVVYALCDEHWLAFLWSPNKNNRDR